MHSKSNSIEILIDNETDEIIEKAFDSLLQKYQKGLEESMEDSELLYYKLHEISLNRSGSCIQILQMVERQKATINPENDDEKCFQYAITVSLNHEQIKKDPPKILKN